MAGGARDLLDAINESDQDQQDSNQEEQARSVLHGALEVTIEHGFRAFQLSVPGSIAASCM
jgi:hypothetical protein